MKTADARKLIKAVERIASAQERIATALEQANAADPLQMISEALAMEQNRPVNLDADLSATKPGPQPEDWRLR